MSGVAFACGLLLAYGGMLALCLGLERHFKQVWRFAPALVLRRGLRGLGWLALVASFGASVAAWGWAMGAVGWFGLIGLSGFALVLLLPYGPRLAVFLPFFGAPLCLLGWVLSG